jgi:hypothetical protein
MPASDVHAQRRIERGVRLFYSRQKLYPPGIRRLRPRELRPPLPPEHTFTGVALENASTAPNEFLYLHRDNTARNYLFLLPSGRHYNRERYPSLFDACIAAHAKGYLDASWK